MRCITFYEAAENGELKVLTEEEYKTQYPDPGTFECDEYVWQEVFTKEEALARHDERFEAWGQDMDRGREQKRSY